MTKLIDRCSRSPSKSKSNACLHLRHRNEQTWVWACVCLCVWIYRTGEQYSAWQWCSLGNGGLFLSTPSQTRFSASIFFPRTLRVFIMECTMESSGTLRFKTIENKLTGKPKVWRYSSMAEHWLAHSMSWVQSLSYQNNNNNNNTINRCPLFWAEVAGGTWRMCSLPTKRIPPFYC